MSVSTVDTLDVCQEFLNDFKEALGFETVRQGADGLVWLPNGKPNPNPTRKAVRMSRPIGDTEYRRIVSEGSSGTAEDNERALREAGVIYDAEFLSGGRCCQLRVRKARPVDPFQDCGLYWLRVNHEPVHLSEATIEALGDPSLGTLINSQTLSYSLSALLTPDELRPMPEAIVRYLEACHEGDATKLPHDDFADFHGELTIAGHSVLTSKTAASMAMESISVETIRKAFA